MNEQEGEWAARLTACRYLVSSSADRPTWLNGTVLGTQPVRNLAVAGQDVRRRLVVHGSIRLARTVLEHDLVLSDTRPVGCSLVRLSYVREPDQA